MKTYTAWTKKAKITVFADNIIEAKKKVLELEKCPECSIEFIGRTPNKKQIKQAKAWEY